MYGMIVIDTQPAAENAFLTSEMTRISMLNNQTNIYK